MVEGPEGFVGFLTRDLALRAPSHDGQPVTLADRADRRYITVKENTPLLEVLTRLRSAKASVAVVTAEANSHSVPGVQGLITRQQIADAAIEGVELFAD